MDLVGRQIGNYIAKAQLGQGGMGVVYLAEHPHIGRKVAVKVLHEELAIDEHMVQRLWLEAKSASEIDSDHIVEVLDFGRMPLGASAGDLRETVYLAMELLEGKSLADRFWEEGITFRDAVDVARQVCTALEASHRKGIIHRDLKPENVFLVERDGKRNFVKILDFGIAKLLSNPYTRTRTGVLLGTPAYMSAEQCRGSGEVDHRSDIYSLGVMLYELTSGIVPFAAQGFGDVLVAHMTRNPEPPSTHNPSIPKNLEGVILRALEKKPFDRFQSMAAFGAALAEVERELDAAAGTHVRSQSSSEQTTERELERTPDAATLMAPPDASLAAVLPTNDLLRPTHGEILHHRETQILGGGMHAQTTLLKNAAGPLPVDNRETHQRLAGVSLREALGSTSAVRQLQIALEERGAPPPVAPDLRPQRPATQMGRKLEPRFGPATIAIAVSVVIVVVAVLMLFTR